MADMTMVTRTHGATWPAALLTVLLGLVAASAPALKPGMPFTTFLGRSLNGEQIELAALQDERVLIVDYWASWSEASIRQRDVLAKWYRTTRPDHYWVSVSLDRDVNVAKGIIERHPAQALNVCDGQGFDSPWALKGDVTMAPTLLIIGKDGIVRVLQNKTLTDEAALGSLLSIADKPWINPEATEVESTGPLGTLSGTRALVNQPAPDFRVTAENIAGKTYTPNDYKGKVLLIIVFASWNFESANFVAQVHEELHRRYQAAGFEMMAVTVETDKQQLLAWMKRNNFKAQFPIVMQRSDDPASITFSTYPMGDGNKMPQCYLVGKNGVMRDIGNLKIERIKQVLVEDLNIPL